MSNEQDQILRERATGMEKVTDAALTLAESPEFGSLIHAYSQMPPKMRKKAMQDIAIFAMGWAERKLA